MEAPASAPSNTVPVPFVEATPSPRGAYVHAGQTPVSVVVVNWNGRDLLRRCLESLETQSYPNTEVVLVDNGSTDDSLQLVASHFPSVVVVRLTDNLGYAGGCNAGVKAASGDYILLLNNDTKLASDVVSRLALDLDRCPRLGAISAVVVSDLNDVANRTQRASTINPLGKHFVKMDSPTDVFYAPGACCMYRRASLDEPFDATYFAYDEDVYLSWLLRLRGLDVAIDRDARFEHWVSSTSRRIRDVVFFHAEKNRWTNFFLFYEARTLAKLMPLAITNILAKILANVEGMRPKLQAYCWLAFHVTEILAKRRTIQRQRLVPDEAITAHMTRRLAAGNGRFTALANYAAQSYLRLLRLPTEEEAIAGDRESVATRAPRTPLMGETGYGENPSSRKE